MRFSTTLISAAALFRLCIAGYVLEDDYMTDFYGNFDFFTEADPTEGFVKYIDEDTARQTNLINGSSKSVVHFGVDVTNKTPEGRPSIRIESKKRYGSGLIVLDIAHMPFGCGTWPAFWTLGPNWPKGGEIDILEGVNEFTNNGMTLHTGPGCKIGDDHTQFSGTVNTDDCDVAAPDQSKNVGCSIEHPSKQSYGAGLNQNGGGVYATAWNGDAISIYFFPRDSIPADVLGDSPNPSGWGKPAAHFEGACDIEEMFKEQKIIIDTTFCGQWAGEVWAKGSCAQKADTCEEFVRDNPEAFVEAYWEINALKVYQDDGKPPTAPSPSAAPPKSSAISIPLPAPTITDSFPTNPPIASSKVIDPIPSSKSASEVPGYPTGTPVTPLPSSKAPVSGRPSPVPQSSRTRGGRPPAPTGPGGMASGWQWPVTADDGTDDTPNATTPVSSIPEASSAPSQNTSDVNATPTSQQNVLQPSSAPEASDAPPAVPFIPGPSGGGPVHTVYETVYITMPAATPAPAVRMARHINEHKRRWMGHGARF